MSIKADKHNIAYELDRVYITKDVNVKLVFL